MKPWLAGAVVVVLSEVKALDSPAMSQVRAPRQIAHASRSSRAEFVRDAASAANDDDEEDIDLPEFIVGDDDAEGEDGTNSFDEELPDLRDDGGDPLDDSNATDLDIGVHLEVTDSNETNLDGAEEITDVGALDEDFVAVDEGSALDEEQPVDEFVEDDDFAGFDKESGDDDGGSEGTGEDAAADIDENALPELDESENDSADDSLAEELLDEAAKARLPPWAASRFVPLEGAGAPLPCSFVTVAAGCVYAAGDVLITIDEGAHAARRLALDVPALAIASTNGQTLVVTQRGGLLASRDGCVSASPVTGFRSAQGPIGLACTHDRFWLLHEGSLWSLSGSELARVREGGVRAMCAASGALVLVTTSAAGAGVEIARGDDEQLKPSMFTEEIAKFVLAEPSLILAAAARGRRLAIASPHALYLSNDAGASFTLVELSGAVAACFAGDDESADLLVVLASAEQPTAHLIRVTDDGEAARLAELNGTNGTNDGRAFCDVSSAWDATREVVWIASRHGLSAWGPARRH